MFITALFMTAQMSFEDKQTVVVPYNAIPFSNVNEQNIDEHDNMGKSLMYYAE